MLPCDQHSLLMSDKGTNVGKALCNMPKVYLFVKYNTFCQQLLKDTNLHTASIVLSVLDNRLAML